MIARYKDRPTRALSTAPAFFYIGVNAAGAFGALYLIYVYRADLGFTAQESDPWPPEANALVKAVLLAGFSSLLFFRTSIFKLRVEDTDMAVGPSIVLDALLAAADRAVDRVMAEPRAQFVHEVMGSVSFEKAVAILPAHCLALMQNVSGEETQRITGVVNALRSDKDTPDKIKTLNLGLALVTVVGEDVLRTAVSGLERDLKDTTAELLPQVADIMRGISFEQARRMLPSYCFALYPKVVSTEDQAKLTAEAKALAEINDVPDDYKAIILGIKLVRLTDGATLKKAVLDLAESLQIRQLAPPRSDDPPNGDGRGDGATGAARGAGAAPVTRPGSGAQPQAVKPTDEVKASPPAQVTTTASG